MTGIEIVKAIAAEHLLTLAEMRSKRRLPRYVAARRSAARALKENRKLTNGQIAVLLHRSPWAVWYYFNSPSKNAKRKRVIQ